MKPLDTLLEQNSLFTQWCVEERDELAHRAIRRQYQKSEFIAHYQEVWPYLLLIEEGMIDLLRESEEGRSLIVATIQPGEVFWGLAFFYDDAQVSYRSRRTMQPASTSGRAIRSCLFC